MKGRMEILSMGLKRCVMMIGMLPMSMRKLTRRINMTQKKLERIREELEG